MNDSVLDFFDNWLNLRAIGNSEDITEQLRKMSSEQLIDFLNSCMRQFDSDLVVSNGEYDFVADVKLSGLPLHCSALPCRVNSLLEMAHFSVLYSDTTYLVNPFEYCISRISPCGELGLTFFTDFTFAIFSTISVRPLIEAGIVKYVPFQGDRFCEDCLSRVFANSGDMNDFTSMLYENFLATTTVSYDMDPNVPALRIEYDESHDEHISYLRSDEIHFDPTIDGKVLSKTELIKFGVFRDRSITLSHDFHAQNHIADVTGAKNIFSQSGQLELLKQFAQPVQSKSQLNLMYPTLTSISLSNALAIRESEWHHIHDFRRALRDLKISNERTALDFREIANIETAKIEKILQKARRQAAGEIFDSAIFGALTVGCAVSTYGTAGLVSAILAAIGTTHIGGKAIPAFRKSLTIPDEARESRFYFGWRVGTALHDRH